MTLDDAWKKISVAGPQFIFQNREGDILLTVLAKQRDPDVKWDVIYIRNDGWSIGCEFYLAQYAEQLYRKEWIGVYHRGAKKPKPLQLS